MKNEPGTVYKNYNNEFSPGNSDPLNNSGNIMLGQGKFDDAVAHFEAAIKIRPYLVKTRYNMGCAYLEVGRYAEAVDHFYKVLQMNSKHAKALMNRVNSSPGVIPTGATTEERCVVEESQGSLCFVNIISFSGFGSLGSACSLARDDLFEKRNLYECRCNEGY